MSEFSVLSEIQELLGDDLSELRERKSAEAQEAREARVAELLSLLPAADAEFAAAAERASKAREARTTLEKEVSEAVSENARARYARAQSGRRRDAIRKELHDLNAEVQK